MGPPFRFVSGTWERKYRLLPKRYVLIKSQRWTEFQQDRQCTYKYNVTLRLAHATIVAAEKQVYIFRERVCSHRYPACKAHARYCHLWPLRHYSIFPHYPINGMIFGKKLLNTKCVFWFSLQVLSETFLVLRRIQRDMIKNVCWYSCKVTVILLRF